MLLTDFFRYLYTVVRRHTTVDCEESIRNSITTAATALQLLHRSLMLPWIHSFVQLVRNPLWTSGISSSSLYGRVVLVRLEKGELYELQIKLAKMP
jgi:hypothetical protein